MLRNIVQYAAKSPVSHLWILMKFSLLNADLISLLERRSDTCKSDEEDSGGSGGSAFVFHDRVFC